MTFDCNLISKWIPLQNRAGRKTCNKCLSMATSSILRVQSHPMSIRSRLRVRSMSRVRRRCRWRGCSPVEFRCKTFARRRSTSSSLDRQTRVAFPPRRLNTRQGCWGKQAAGTLMSRYKLHSLIDRARHLTCASSQITTWHNRVRSCCDIRMALLQSIIHLVLTLMINKV